MMNSLYSAATGMMAMQSNIDVIANNLANVNTNGFKSTRLTFEDLLYQQLGDRNAARAGAQAGMGVAPGRTEFNFASGDLRETKVSTNMAIEGQGFFQVALPNGQVGYTRDGNFNVDSNGQLVTGSGYILEPSVVIPIETDVDTVNITPSGRIEGKVNGVPTVFGQIDMAQFANPSGLTALGNNTYAATVNSGAPQVGEPGTGSLGTVRQGFIEGSNVSVMTEMVDMINAQRAFESVSKVISTSDEMLGIANSMRR